MTDKAHNEFLADPRRYLVEFERLIQRLRDRGGAWSSRQWDASPADVWNAREAFAERLTRTVVDGDYRLGPVQASLLELGSKTRTLHRFAWVDQVVVGTLARGLSALAEPELPDALHSYRPGRSPVTAIGSLQRFLRAHRRDTPLRQRGLYVLRRDVKSYGERIPNDPRSALWSTLRRVTARMDDSLRPIAEALLRQALRPEVIQPNGHRAPLELGTPTGSPLQPLVNNLYLTALDHAMTAIDGGLYLRFGDDILFAHHHAPTAQAADAHLSESLAQHGLAFNDDKQANLYWNGCGRHSPAWPDAKGAAHLEFLGYRIDFEGSVALKPRRVRLLTEDLRRRWRNTLKLTDPSDADLRRRRLCRVTAEALNPRRPLHHAAIAQLHAVNDRKHLRQLDFTIALAAAEHLSDRRGVRAFRNEPYRQLRAAGLPSLLVARNRATRSRTADKDSLRMERTE